MRKSVYGNNFLNLMAVYVSLCRFLKTKAVFKLKIISMNKLMYFLMYYIILHVHFHIIKHTSSLEMTF